MSKRNTGVSENNGKKLQEKISIEINDEYIIGLFMKTLFKIKKIIMFFIKTIVKINGIENNNLWP